MSSTSSSTESATDPRILIIVNPVAGRGAAARAVPQIRAGLDALGLHAEVVCTQYPWHAAEIA